MPVDAEADEFVIGVGVQLHALRRARHLSRGQVVSRSGLAISVTTLCAYELGTGTLNLRRLFVLSHTLGATPRLVLEHGTRTHEVTP